MFFMDFISSILNTECSDVKVDFELTKDIP